MYTAWIVLLIAKIFNSTGSMAKFGMATSEDKAPDDLDGLSLG